MSLGNTATRIIVSVAAIPLILLACYFGSHFFLLFIAAIGAAAFWEFSHMARNKNAFALDALGLIAVLLIITNAYYRFMDFKMLVYFVVVLLLVYELFRNKSSAIFNLGTTLLGIFYIGLFSGSMIEIREYFPHDYKEGGILMISILVAIWVCDSAAFFAGSALGKHKLFPRVSPKKSWEGAIAGFIAAVIAMIVMKILFLHPLSVADSAVIGLVVGTIGQIGDLTESLIKRDAGVKDSSNIIPGHGGIFDRFDSLLLSSPVVYLYLVYFVK
ncbi:MAG: phosphatidate cytidylyltransferase [Syntrophomonadaceae bacterium]